MALGSALYGDAVAHARLQIFAQLRNEELAVEIAIVAAGVQPIAQPRDDMHQLARLLESELNLGILGRVSPQPYQRIEGGKVVGDAMRHLAQLKRLCAALVREPHVGIGEADKGAMNLIGHDGGANGKERIKAYLEDVDGARRMHATQRLKEKETQQRGKHDGEHTRSSAEQEGHYEHAGEEQRERIGKAFRLERKLSCEAGQDQDEGARKLDDERPDRRLSDRSDHRGGLLRRYLKPNWRATLLRWPRGIMRRIS